MGNLAHGAAWVYEGAGKSRRAGTGIAGRLLPEGSDGVACAMDLTVFVYGYCGVASPIDPFKCGMDIAGLPLAWTLLFHA